MRRLDGIVSKNAMEGLSLLLVFCVGLHAHAANSSFAQEPGQGGAGGCQFCYTEQPPDELPCNPYINSELRLECMVEAPVGSRPQVVWFRNTEGGLQQDSCLSEMLQNTEGADGQPKISIQPQSRTDSSRERIFVRSRLQLHRLNDSVAGAYWCTIVVNGSEFLNPSDPVYLQPSAVYSDFTTSCPLLSAVSKQERKCADLVETVPKPSHTCYTISSTPQAIALTQTVTPTLQSGIQETVSSSNFIGQSPLPTVTPALQRSVVIVQSPLPTPVLHNTYTSSSSTLSSNLAATPVISIEEDGRGTYTPELDATTRTTFPSSNNQELLLELYIAIGVLVLFSTVIIVLLPISIWLCVKGQYLKTDTKRQAASETSVEGGSVILTASDYLVPIRTTNPKATSTHGYETALSISANHDYEDIVELEENYVYTDPIKLNRNRAYRACSVQDELIDNHLHVQVHVLNCTREQT